jgi:wobble nucleotide-excising tRNase
MIVRFKKIFNVGRLVSYTNNSRGDGCKFDINTIIFGDNTRGKSTLTSIFKSLNTGNANLIIGRKTFGSTTAQEIEIDYLNNNNRTINFANGNWSQTCPIFWIFDSQFISRNIFEGETITFNQQKNLESIIIGEEGKRIRDKITEYHGKVNDIARKKSEATISFRRSFSNIILDDFIKLKEDPDIDKSILEKVAEINRTTNETKLNTLLTKNIFTVNFTELKEIFSKNFKFNSKLVETHIEKNWIDNEHTLSFLEEGVSLLKPKKENCVFCGQDLNEASKELITNYEKLFNENYKEYQSKILELGNKFLNFAFEQILERQLLEFDKLGVKIDISDETKKQLFLAKKRIDVKIEQKQKNLEKDFDFINDDDFEQIETELGKIKIKLEEIKDKLVSSKKTIEQLLLDKRKLEITKQRFEPQWIKFCKDSTSLDEQNKINQKARDDARKNFEAYSNEVFNSHKKKINSLLLDMGADFEIDQFQPTRKLIGDDERIFVIKFLGNHLIRINQNNDNVPNFKNTLSESDKRMLAFSFFLSLLSNDRELDKKIIIFDDPFSSFDLERKRKTIHLLADIYFQDNQIRKYPMQKIILTHERQFLKELIKKDFNSAKVLLLEPYIEDSIKKSRISNCDFESLFPDDEIIEKLRSVKLLKDSGGNFDEKTAADCRAILENIFKRKYLFELETEIAMKKSIRTFSEKIFSASLDKKTSFLRLCDDLHIELHDNQSVENTYGDKDSILRDFFMCLKEI